MSLSPAEVKTVQDSWSEVCKDKKKHGNGFFYKLMETHKDVQPYFKAFKDKQLADLKDSDVLTAHSALVLGGLDGMITNLANPADLSKKCEELAKNHTARNVGPPYFRKAFDVLCAYLNEALGGQAQAEWKKALDAAFAALDAEYKKL